MCSSISVYRQTESELSPPQPGITPQFMGARLGLPNCGFKYPYDHTHKLADWFVHAHVIMPLLTVLPLNFNCAVQILVNPLYNLSGLQNRLTAHSEPIGARLGTPICGLEHPYDHTPKLAE